MPNRTRRRHQRSSPSGYRCPCSRHERDSRPHREGSQSDAGNSEQISESDRPSQERKKELRKQFRSPKCEPACEFAASRYSTSPAAFLSTTSDSTAVSDLSGRCEQKPMPT